MVDIRSAVLGAIGLLIVALIVWIATQVAEWILDDWHYKKMSKFLKSFEFHMAIKDVEVDYQKSLRDSLQENRCRIDNVEHSLGLLTAAIKSLTADKEPGKKVRGG